MNFIPLLHMQPAAVHNEAVVVYSVAVTDVIDRTYLGTVVIVAGGASFVVVLGIIALVKWHFPALVDLQ